MTKTPIIAVAKANKPNLTSNLPAKEVEAATVASAPEAPKTSVVTKIGGRDDRAIETALGNEKISSERAQS
jgi:hypothetical protein